MSKKKQSEAKQVALEAIDLVIAARKAELEAKRREQVRLNRGEEASWDEARKAAKFNDKVLAAIEANGVDLEGDLTFGEQVTVLKLVSERADDYAFKWASRKAASAAADDHEDEMLNSWVVGIVRRTRALVGSYLTWAERDDFIKQGFHGCDDLGCIEQTVTNIKAVVEERKRKHVEALVNEATRGTMTLDEFSAYVNTGQLKQDVDEALKPFEGVIAYMRDGVLEVLEGLADIAYGSDGDAKADEVTVSPVMKVVDGGVTIELHPVDVDQDTMTELVRRAGFRKD